jgi:methylase of polypeptide subunit release factors
MTPPPRRKTRPVKARVGAQHADWLTLVEPVGQFLTLPVLRRVFPAGLDVVDREQRIVTREWAAALDRSNPGEATAWIEHLLRDLLGWGPRLVTGPAVPDQLAFTVAEHQTTLRPEHALLDTSGKARALVEVYPYPTSLDARIPGDRWAASPIERTATLCRALGVPIGIVTNARHVVLVHAPIGAVGGHGTWDTELFAEGAEASLMDAFVSLLGAKRFFAAAPGDRLEDLFTESANAQAELTSTLGLQVRRAVELLVASLSRADVEAEGRLLRGVAPQRVYEAATTVMMRLVFLLYAEERGLLPLGEALYDDNYAVSTLREQLQEQSDRDGDEPLELRSAAWHRLLATFRTVYAGVSHDRLRMPPYGGSLFDPDRFGFLEGRHPDEPWAANPSRPVPVDDLTVREILTALQVIRTTEAGATEARRLSFRALDVEQIGHVYEGTLDHSALRAATTVVGLVGRQGMEPEVQLDALEANAAQARDSLVAFVAEQTGRSAKQITALLDKAVDADVARKVRTAADNDEALTTRLLPFAHLLRDDLRGLPVVFIPGTIYVTETSHRRDTGTEYTPRELAEEIVLHALEPLVYEPGPAQGADRADWVLKPSAEILKLRVCDPAVGSGAILVAACRYLADRLVEAWTAEGAVPEGYAPDPAATPDEDELTIQARRAIADQCLYGVDRDAMAVEMAKLSLWLTTMSRERPFTFVDHAIRAGDSLLGLTSLDQVTAFHMDPARGRDLHKDLFLDLHATLKPLVDEALELRRDLTALPVVTVRDVERKQALNARAEQLLAMASVIADTIVGAALCSGGNGKKLDDLLVAARPLVVAAVRDPEALGDLRARAEEMLNRGRPDAAPLRHPLHWPLAFPDVMRAGGFDAMVGNPPFLGGQRLTARIGTDMRELLVRRLADGRRGSADLVSYFFLRAAQVARGFGFIATNTIAQGDTREVCLDALLADRWTIHAANKSRPWPGAASLEVAQVWLTDRPWSGPVVADGTAVPGVTATLDPVGKVSGNPQRLAANAGIAFQGSIVLGLGFTLTEAEAQAMIDADPRNAEVLFPYLNGQDLNSSPTQSASRWVINFFDWPQERARAYALPFAKVERDVKPERMRNNRKVYRDSWWQYAEKRPAMLAAIAGLERVIVVARVSRTFQPVRVPSAQVFDDKLVVHANQSEGLLGLLSSAAMWTWALQWGTTLRSDLTYTPAAVFQTFPFPPFLAPLEAPGVAMEAARHAVMHGRTIGLTATYNVVNTPAATDDDVVALRHAHVALDEAVLAAYGWQDLALDHGFHDTAQGRRFTIATAVRVELLDRLLELNHRRYGEEVAAGLHAKRSREKSRPRASKGAAPDNQGRLL